uniref:Uncharacterized protein n=1 Tax=Parascaris univalens TaxID=6257 RepID=A0A915A276_PARUN
MEVTMDFTSRIVPLGAQTTMLGNCCKISYYLTYYSRNTIMQSVKSIICST